MKERERASEARREREREREKRNKTLLYHPGRLEKNRLRVAHIKWRRTAQFGHGHHFKKFAAIRGSSHHDFTTDKFMKPLAVFSSNISAERCDIGLQLRRFGRASGWAKRRAQRV